VLSQIAWRFVLKKPSATKNNIAKIIDFLNNIARIAKVMAG